MTGIEALSWYLYMMVAGFIVGITWSVFLYWWKPD